MDDFEAALAAKVAASEEATTTVETPASAENVAEVATEVEAAQEQPRDPETGRFVSKFKSWEEAEKAFENAQQVLGRQGHELGELRQMVQQISERDTQPQPPGSLREALEESPDQVALYALQQGNEQLLDQAISSWYQKGVDEDDPRILREVGRFERALEMAQFKQELSSSLVPALESVKSESEVRALALAQRDLRAKYPDFDQVMESVTEGDVEGLDPAAIRQLKDADPKAALEVVYRWVSAGRRTQESAATDERRAEALKEKREAVVATSSAAPGEREKSPKDLLREALLTPEAHSVHHSLVRE